MRTLACALLVTLTCGTAAASEYDTLRALRPDGRSVKVTNLTLTRDAHRIDFKTGTIHLLAPFGADTFGAVFIGDGTYQLTPATPVEKNHLRLVLNDSKLEVLTDRFSRMFLFFTDKTAAEILAGGEPATGAPSKDAISAYEDYLDTQRRNAPVNGPMRVLTDLLNRPNRTDGVFLAYMEGRSLGKLSVSVDPLGLSNLSPQFIGLGGEETALISNDQNRGGFWYMSTLRDRARSGHGVASQLMADAASYTIDTEIDGGSIHQTTTIVFTPLVNGLRVLPLNISRWLDLKSVTLENDGSVPVAVMRDRERVVTANTGLDPEVALLFPAPLPAGRPARLKIIADGRNILSGVDGVYSVRERDSWYPNIGTFVDIATYDLTFRYPRNRTLVSVGQLVSEEVQGNQKISVWKAAQPIRVAGFNYGEFDKLTTTDKETGVVINVYTNKDWTPQARMALADAANASRLGNLFFGKPPFTHLSMAQQVEGNFGQSWPTLVFLPTTALLTMGDLANSIVSPELREALETVGWHEVSHQWWGHQVGWQSYRDQWLSEGFAEFTAALMLEAVHGPRTYDKFWNKRRSDLFDGRGKVAPADAGPITQGIRLSTERSPSAYSVVAYEKGAFVLHMLRMQMRDEANREDPDRAFRAMMKDFVTTWTDKSPSTDDFQALVEKHMLPKMDLAKNRKMDYFFDQWVRGTDLPKLSSSLSVAEAGPGRYRITGTVTQAQVPDGFLTLVPVYLDFGDNRIQKLGDVTLTGSSSQNVTVELALPAKPKAVINLRNDVLTR